MSKCNKIGFTPLEMLNTTSVKRLFDHRKTNSKHYIVNLKRSPLGDLPARLDIRSGGSLTGFTLIEIIVVLSIILLIATLIIPGLIEARYRAKVAMAKTQIAEMEKAITMYEMDYGCNPADQTGNSSKALINALKGDPESDPPKRPYYVFKENDILNNEYYSPLRKPYYYRENASETIKTNDMKNPFKYDIWTDDLRKIDENDGINNWE